MWLFWALGFLLGSAVFNLIRSLSKTASNYRAAKKLGLPVVVSPINARNVVWLLTQKYIGPIIYAAPFGLGAWARFTVRGWLWEDHEKVHQKLGKVWVAASPKGLDVSGTTSPIRALFDFGRHFYSADTDIINQVYARRKDFDRSPEVRASIPNLLQGSVSTVSGADWQRQRRITAHPFNEQNMTLVWGESLRQAAALCDWWESNKEGFTTSCDDTMTVALNVLATAGLGQSWKFRPSTSQDGGRRDTSKAESADYRDTMATLLSSMNVLTLTPDWMYALDLKYVPLLPLSKSWKGHIIAAKHFRMLMHKMVDERRAEFRDGKIKDNIFLNAMIAESEASVSEKGGAGGLSDGELFGNMFAYSVAGHETTAHTLNYTLHILAARPEWQDWIQEEVDQVYQHIPTDAAEISYADYYPRLTRCLALMHEVLRLYPPVLEHTKQALGPEGQSLRIDGREVYLPPNTTVHLNVLGCHTMSEYWGPDQREFKPSRWIKNDQASSEQFHQPTKEREAFFPWSLGSRLCPGKKFALVEYVAIISYVLKHQRFEVIPLKGETPEAARARAWDNTRDSVPEVTMNMRNPGAVRLRMIGRTAAAAV